MGWPVATKREARRTPTPVVYFRDGASAGCTAPVIG